MSDTDTYPDLTQTERDDIVEILNRRSNEVVTFEQDLKRSTAEKIPEFPGSVQLAISRETDRLRKLSYRVRQFGTLINPPETDDSDDL